jgi:glutamate-1-semialdehyde 2,1-aminomutase
MPNGVKSNAQYPQIAKSQEWLARAEKRIPSNTQTLAKGPTQYVKGVAPIYLQRGKGARVWDVDGNEYLDFNMAIGPVSLGYAYERVDQAITRQLTSGITFSLMHPLEVEVAEMLSEVIPNAERVRFSKTGADVTSAAIRAARAYTGRKKIVCCGYHGWHDWYIGATTRHKGIPEEVSQLTRTFSYNDLKSLSDAVDSQTACVILEPVLFEPPKDDFLYKVRELCSARGVVLIFDEMWTGFRLSMGGAQSYFDVKADLATFSKAMANGMPIAALTGRRDIMDLFNEEIFFYTTFGGETLSLAAAKATISELQEKKVPAHLAQLGLKLREGYIALAENLGMNYTQCVGLDCRTMVTFSPAGDELPLEMKSLVQQELIKRGILWSGAHALSYSHQMEDIDYLLEAYAEVLPILRNAVAEGMVRRLLKGEPVKPVFRTVTGSPVQDARK